MHFVLEWQDIYCILYRCNECPMGFRSSCETGMNAFKSIFTSFFIKPSNLNIRSMYSTFLCVLACCTYHTQGKVTPGNGGKNGSSVP